MLTCSQVDPGSAAQHHNGARLLKLAGIVLVGRGMMAKNLKGSSQDRGQALTLCAQASVLHGSCDDVAGRSAKSATLNERTIDAMMN